MTESHKPVYQRLYETYKADILAFRLRPGERVDSVVEMQKKFGVGRETAKRVLGLLAEAGYIVQRRGKGSFVADQRARIPEEIHAVSYGNTELSRYFTPPITSVDPHDAEMATTLCDLLYHNGESTAPTTRYPSRPGDSGPSSPLQSKLQTRVNGKSFAFLYHE